jgi:hypothetical protein
MFIFWFIKKLFEWSALTYLQHPVFVKPQTTFILQLESKYKKWFIICEQQRQYLPM